MREKIEWTNTWIAKADSAEESRILLIGDSVTRNIRSELDRFILGGMPVDLFASSYAFDDEAFWRSIEVFLASGYFYEVIVINYGFHHGYRNFLNIDVFDEQKYISCIKRLIDICDNNANRIIFMTGTSYALKNDLSMIDEEKEKRIKLLNTLYCQVASEI